jgi:hypothetical protein
MHAGREIVTSVGRSRRGFAHATLFVVSAIRSVIDLITRTGTRSVKYSLPPLCALGLTVPTHGDDQPVTDDAPALAGTLASIKPSLRLQATSGVWLPRLGGDVELGGSGSTINLEETLELDDLDPMPSFELAIRKKDFWTLRISGFHFETDADGDFPTHAAFGSLTLAPGDEYEASAEVSSFAVEIGAALLHPFKGDLATAQDADLRLRPMFGARYLDVDQSIRQVGVGKETGEGEWIALLAGLEVNLRFDPAEPVLAIPFLDALELEGGGSVGPALGGDGGFVWQVRGGLRLVVNPNFEMMIGYRLLELEVENDDYAFNAGLQGLYLAATVSF